MRNKVALVWLASLMLIGCQSEPEGYMTFDVVFDSEEISSLIARLTDEIALTYVPAE